MGFRGFSTPCPRRSAATADLCAPASHCHVASGDQTQYLMFAEQVFYPRSHLQSPLIKPSVLSNPTRNHTLFIHLENSNDFITNAEHGSAMEI